MLRHCAYTRIRNRDGEIEVLPADISAAMFQHGTSRDNDPQLHTHCVIFNAARTHRDGKYRALHQHPVYTWMKAAGAVYRNAMAWSLQERLGIRIEQYGKDGEFTRIAGMPGDLIGHWSKRRAAIIDAAREMGFTVEGNAPRAVPPIYSIHRRNLGILHHHRIPFPACIIRSSKSSRTVRRSTQKSLPCDSR